MWARLRDRQFYDIKFRLQYPIGRYIVDFVCLEKKLIIEIDGWQHKEEFSGSRECEREDFLKANGFTVLRFWNNEVDGNSDGVFLKIGEVLDNL